MNLITHQHQDQDLFFSANVFVNRENCENLHSKLVWLFEACLNLESQVLILGSLSGDTLEEFCREVSCLLSFELFPELDRIMNFQTFGESTAIVYDSYRSLMVAGTELSFITDAKKIRYSRSEVLPMFTRFVSHLRLLIEVISWHTIEENHSA